jgi:hypothetical protein
VEPGWQEDCADQQNCAANVIAGFAFTRQSKRSVPVFMPRFADSQFQSWLLPLPG